MATKTIKQYDALIVGAGLSGISLSLLLVKHGFSVAIFDQDNFPRQKVCGEYISMESYNFIQQLGLDLDRLNLPRIDSIFLTNELGQAAQSELTGSGGFGISRWMLDFELIELAKRIGVEVFTNTKVLQVNKEDDSSFSIQTLQKEVFSSRIVVGAFGRVSTLKAKDALKNKSYIGIKYHINEGPASHIIEMHQFDGGYCGVSQVEGDKYCLCYLVEAEQLKKVNGEILLLEQHVLAKNPFLKKRLEHTKLTEVKATSQFVFGVESAPLDYPLLGDAAGFIPPISGNGMSLAFRSANELAPSILRFLQNEIGLKEVLSENQRYNTFYLNSRINKGIQLQKLILNSSKMIKRTMFVCFRLFPWSLKFLSKKAVGLKIESSI